MRVCHALWLWKRCGIIYKLIKNIFFFSFIFFHKWINESEKKHDLRSIHIIYSLTVSHSPMTALNHSKWFVKKRKKWREKNKQESVFISQHWARFKEIAVDNYGMNKRWRLAKICTSGPFVSRVSCPPLLHFSLAQCISPLFAFLFYYEFLHKICVCIHIHIFFSVVTNFKSKLYAKFTNSQSMNMISSSRSIALLNFNWRHERARSCPIDCPWVLWFGVFELIDEAFFIFFQIRVNGARPCRYVWQRFIVCAAIDI